MKLSIIIPTYKQDSYYLYQCINSIYNQINFDYKDLEVLVVKDDLEPISTVGCISSFPIKLIQTPKNLGCAGARELGIAHSTGDYIYFMDSDDFLFSPLSLSHMLKIVEEHQDYDWWTFDYYHDCDHVCYSHHMVSIYAIVFRRSLINKYNIKANKINRYEDACFIGQYAYCVGFDKEYKDSTFPIYCYRHNKNSLTNATQISNEEVLKADIQSCWLIWNKLKEFNKQTNCFYTFMVVRFVKELDLLLKDGLTSSFTSDFRNQYDALMDAADDKWEALTDSDIEYLKRCFGPKWMPIEVINLYRKFRFNS